MQPIICIYCTLNTPLCEQTMKCGRSRKLANSTTCNAHPFVFFFSLSLRLHSFGLIVDCIPHRNYRISQTHTHRVLIDFLGLFSHSTSSKYCINIHCTQFLAVNLLFVFFFLFVLCGFHQLQCSDFHLFTRLRTLCCAKIVMVSWDRRRITILFYTSSDEFEL